MKTVAIQYCVDCYKPISLGAKRCRDCFHKSTRGRVPHNKGKKTVFVVCVDCGKRSYHNGKSFNYTGGIKKRWLRCRKCNSKRMSKIPRPWLNRGVGSGKDNPNYGKRGEGVTNWRGGVTFSVQGYKKVRVDNHPKSENGYILEHRLVMERHLGRYLDSDEHIHHIDGSVSNNNIKNLMLVDKSEHMKIHWEERRRQ